MWEIGGATLVGAFASVVYGVLVVASARAKSGAPMELGRLFLVFLPAGAVGGVFGGIRHPLTKRSPLHRWCVWVATLLPFMFLAVRVFGVAGWWKAALLAVSFSVIAAALVPLLSGSTIPDNKDWG